MPEIACPCGKSFQSSDSVGSNQGLCQDCWEALVADEWWKLVGEGAD